MTHTKVFLNVIKSANITSLKSLIKFSDILIYVYVHTRIQTHIYLTNQTVVRNFTY